MTNDKPQELSAPAKDLLAASKTKLTWAEITRIAAVWWLWAQKSKWETEKYEDDVEYQLKVNSDVETEVEKLEKE